MLPPNLEVVIEIGVLAGAWVARRVGRTPRAANPFKNGKIFRTNTKSMGRIHVVSSSPLPFVQASQHSQHQHPLLSLHDTQEGSHSHEHSQLVSNI